MEPIESSSYSIDYWRSYFNSAKSDIFDVIENAITIAALDYGSEFRARRDSIAEILFCSKIGSAPSDGMEIGEPSEGCKDPNAKTNGDIGNVSPNEDTDVLTGEIDEGRLEEILEIKKILLNKESEPDSVLLHQLEILRSMGLSIYYLQASMIGEVVNHLRKHRSKEVRNLSKKTVREWKTMVTEILQSQKHTTEHKPTSGNTPGKECEDHCPPTQTKTVLEDERSPLTKKHKKPSSSGSGLEREEANVMLKKPLSTRPEPDTSNKFSEEKFEAAKRKLVEGYEQHEKEKQQRTVRILDVRELPRKGNGRGRSSGMTGRSTGLREPGRGLVPKQ